MSVTSSVQVPVAFSSSDRTDRGYRRLHHAAGAAGRHQHELQLARIEVVYPEAELHAFDVARAVGQLEGQACRGSRGVADGHGARGGAPAAVDQRSQRLEARLAAFTVQPGTSVRPSTSVTAGWFGWLRVAVVARMYFTSR
ncbi:hypothetical protein G6F61_014155 [Rhizopus arrhizus]|nr:hypothetical protein G6F61_014155 [Rhizopus arrhizus]